MDLDAMVATASLGPDFPLPADAPFTRAAALRAGVGRRAFDRLVTEGLLHSPIRSVYVATQVGDSLALRAACLRLAVPPDAVIVDRHAGWLHGAEMVLRPGEHLNVSPVATYLPTPRRRLRNGLTDSGERAFGPHDVVEVDGLRVTAPLRTAWDLGRTRWVDDALISLDAMARTRRFSVLELELGVERFREMRWVTTLRAAAPLADPRSESSGESVLRLRCFEARLRVVPQFEVWHDGRLVARLDLADEELMLAVEYDGEEWHSSPEQIARDAARREDLVALGWTVLSFTSKQVFGQARTVDLTLVETARELRRRRGRRLAN